MKWGIGKVDVTNKAARTWIEKAMRMGTGQAQERRKKGEGQGMGVESVTVGRGMVRLNKQ